VNNQLEVHLFNYFFFFSVSFVFLAQPLAISLAPLSFSYFLQGTNSFVFLSTNILFFNLNQLIPLNKIFVNIFLFCL